MGKLFETLLCWLQWMISSVPWAIIQAVNLMLKGLAAVVNAAISLLPESNSEVPKLGSDIIGLLNWLFPVGPLVVEATLIVTAWALYKTYRYLFRWVV